MSEPRRPGRPKGSTKRRTEAEEDTGRFWLTLRSASVRQMVSDEVTQEEVSRSEAVNNLLERAHQRESSLLEEIQRLQSLIKEMRGGVESTEENDADEAKW